MLFLEQTYLHPHYMNLMGKLQFNRDKLQMSVLTWWTSWPPSGGPVSVPILSFFVFFN